MENSSKKFYDIKIKSYLTLTIKRNSRDRDILIFNDLVSY